MTTTQIKNARRLQAQGQSLQAIATEFGVSKSALFRALKDEDTMPIGETPENDSTLEPASKPVDKRPSPATVGNIELGKLDLELSHKREMTKMEMDRDALALQRRQIEIAAQQVENDKKMLAIREQQINEEQRAEDRKVANYEEMLVSRHNRLVRELLKNCEDATWSEHEADEFMARIKATCQYAFRRAISANSGICCSR